MSPSQQDYHLKEIIHAPAAAIFGTLTDFASLQKFVPNIVRAHRPEPEGPFAVGTQWEETRNLLFLRDSLHLEVTDVQPTSRVQWVLNDGHATFTYTFSLLPTISSCGRDATDVLCDVLCTACYGGTAAARLACFMQQKDTILLQRLKHILESDEAAAGCSHRPAGPIAVC